MIKERKENLEEAIKKEWQKSIVKNLFIDYESSYKQLRNPTKEQSVEYYEMYLLYNEYMIKRETKLI